MLYQAITIREASEAEIEFGIENYATITTTAIASSGPMFLRSKSVWPEKPALRSGSDIHDNRE